MANPKSEEISITVKNKTNFNDNQHNTNRLLMEAPSLSAQLQLRWRAMIYVYSERICFYTFIGCKSINSLIPYQWFMFKNNK